MSELPELIWKQAGLRDKFKLFKQRLELYFKLKKIADNKEKCCYLLRALDDDALEVFNSWNLQDDKAEAYDEVIKCFEEALGQTTVNFRVARLQLHYMYQDRSETLDNFVTRCRTQALSCDFEKKELQDRIVEQIIASTPIDAFQTELLGKDKALTLDKAIEIGRKYEAAMFSVEKLKGMASGHNSGTSVDFMKKSSSNLCKNCGKDHPQEPTACPARNSRCYSCGETGHWGKFCQSKRRGRSNSHGRGRGHGRSHSRNNRHQRSTHKKGGHGNSGRGHKKGVDSVEHPGHRQEKSEEQAQERFYDSIEVVRNEAVDDQNSDGAWRTKAFVFLEVEPDNGYKGKQTLKLKVDSGAEANIMPLSIFKSMFPQKMEDTGLPRLPSIKGIRLSAYNGTTIKCYGEVWVPSYYDGRQCMMHFYVVDTPGPAIMGLPTGEFLKIIQLNCSVERSPAEPKAGGQDQDVRNRSEKQPIHDVSDLKRLYPNQFDRLGDLGEDFEAKLILKADAEPYIDPPRKYPIHKTEQIKAELDKMEELGVIRRVTQHTEWCSSLAFATKSDGTLRVCLDPAKLNKALSRCPHKMPNLEELNHRLSGATVFSKVDAKTGYWSIRMDEKSQLLTTFRTPFGRYCFNRLPFGLSVSQDIFQQAMDTILEQCHGVVGKADDITVFGKNKSDHDASLHHLFQTAEKYGLVFNSAKCQISMKQVSFFGNDYSSKGISPSPEKVRDLQNCAEPTCAADLQRFLGFIQFLAPFIQNLSDKAAPLRDLLKEETPWCWHEDHAHIFKGLKSIITDDCCLQYYDTSQPVEVHCDASLRGTGACLMQPRVAGETSEVMYAPVAYASKALTPTEQRYSNLERELLSIVYGVERFSMYLYGREFTVVTDHRPLEAICTKNLTQAPPRVQRLLLRLQGYDFKVVYKPGKFHIVPDWLSRAPNQENQDPIQLDVRVDFISFGTQKLLELQEATKGDPVMQVLTSQIMAGWPKTIKEIKDDIRPFWDYRDELSVENGLVVKGCRIIVPTAMREYIMEKLHTGHLGITKCQLRARDSVFWPGINQQIKDLINRCLICQKYQDAQMREEMIPHDVPTTPWTKVGSDLFHFQGDNYVLVTDYTTKYAVVRKLPTTAPSSTVIAVHKRIFSDLGVPQEIVSDRGPHYKAQEFGDFCRQWGITHTCSSPTYAQSNGAAERAIKTVKGVLKKSLESGEEAELALLAWRCTPLDGTTRSPAEMMFGRKLCINLPIRTTPLPEDVLESRRKKQEQAVDRYNQSARSLPPLRLGTRVMFQDGDHWRPGEITETNDHRSYQIRTSTGTHVVRNRRHIKPLTPPVIAPVNHTSEPPEHDNAEAVATEPQHQPDIVQAKTTKHVRFAEPDRTAYVTRSGRAVNPPTRFNYP